MGTNTTYIKKKQVISHTYLLFLSFLPQGRYIAPLICTLTFHAHHLIIAKPTSIVRYDHATLVETFIQKGTSVYSNQGSATTESSRSSWKVPLYYHHEVLEEVRCNSEKPQQASFSFYLHQLPLVAAASDLLTLLADSVIVATYHTGEKQTKNAISLMCCSTSVLLLQLKPRHKTYPSEVTVWKFLRLHRTW